MIRAALILAGLLALPGASFAQSICAMPEEAAIKSKQCVRWYFACLKADGKVAPELQDIPFAERLKMIAQLKFRLAETQCETFDYVQASAALDAELKSIP